MTTMMCNPAYRVVRGAAMTMALVLMLCARAAASLDGVTPADKAADIDWPMYSDPDLGAIPIIVTFDARMKDIWLASLKRPDVETRRRAAYEIGLAAEKGMKNLEVLVRPLIEQMDAPDAHPVLMLAAAEALIQLDAKAAAASFLMHNERGAASGVIRGDTVGKDGKPAGGNAGIEFALLTDAALAKWRHEPAIAVWMKRLTDPATPRTVRVSAITQLAAVKHAPAIEPIKALALDRALADASLRIHAAQSVPIGDTGNPATIGDALLGGSLVDRLVAATLLARIEGNDAVASLLKLAADREPAVATIALRRLLEIDPKHIAATADKLLTSADPTVRLLAATSLVAGKSPQVVVALAPLLDDPSPQVRYYLRDRFIEFGKDEPLGATVREQATRVLAGGANITWRGIEQAAVILGRLDHEPVAARLIELLPYPRNEVRIAAIVALRRLAVNDAAQLAAITAHLERESDIWLAMVEAAKKDTSRPFLIDAQRDRQLAQMHQMLGIMRYEPARKVMERYVPKMSGFWSEGRAGAVWALGKLYEDKPNVALSKSFVSRLSDLDPNNPELIHVRRMAAISLGRMKATDSLKALEVFYDVERTSLHVGGGCRWALMRITGKDLPPLPSREASETGWFIQPLAEPKEEKK